MDFSIGHRLPVGVGYRNGEIAFAVAFDLAFRGRAPTIDALLQQSGLSEAAALQQPSDR